MSFISWADAVALVFFVLGWSLYNWALESSRFRTRSIAAVMAQYRRQWMRVMSGRELRMIDSMLQGTLMHGVAFLASTSILMVGVLTAMLGLSDNALNMGLYLPGKPRTGNSRSSWCRWCISTPSSSFCGVTGCSTIAPY